MLFRSLSASELVERGRTAGLSIVQEVFADRAYRSDGTLVPRSESGALLKTEHHLLRQLHDILNGFVRSIDGQRIALQSDSLCIHADTPHSVEFVRLVRAEIQSAGIDIAKPRAT